MDLSRTGHKSPNIYKGCWSLCIYKRNRSLWIYKGQDTGTNGLKKDGTQEPIHLIRMLEPSGMYFTVADPDSGSDAFLTPVPGSGIGFSWIPAPQTHIFESLVTIFWIKSSIIL
jgi:hypothetical protein